MNYLNHIYFFNIFRIHLRKTDYEQSIV